MGAKNYMNKDQRSEFITLNTLAGYMMRKLIPEWSQRKYITTEEIAELEQATALLLKVKDSILGRMDKDYMKVLERDAKELQIITLPKYKAKITLEEFKESDDVVEVARIVVDTMASVTLELCSNCHKNMEEQHDCILRICHFACGIEPFDPDAEGCPFKIEGMELKNEFFIDFMKKFLRKLKEKGGAVCIGTDEEPYGKETSRSAQEVWEEMNEQESKDS